MRKTLLMALMLAFTYAVAFDGNNQQLEHMRKKCKSLCEKYDNEKLLTESKRYAEIASKGNNIKHKAYSTYYLGVAYMYTEQTAKAHPLFEKMLRLSQDAEDDTLISLSFNSLAGYESMININLFIAQNYYIQALRHAKKCNNERLCSYIYGNMSEIAYQEKDTNGLKYAHKCYESGVKIKNKSCIAFGRLTMARQYYIRKKYKEALANINKAQQYYERNKYNSIGNIYMTKAAILCEMNKLSEAEKYILLAIQHNDGKGVAIDAYYIAAKIYYKMRRYDTSMDYCKMAIKSVETNKVKSSLAETYMLMAKIKQTTNNYKQAYQYLLESKQLYDKIYVSSQKHLEEERKMGYLIGIKERDMAQQKEKAKLSRNLNIILTLAIVALIIALLAVMGYFKKRNKIYKNIVEQSLEKIKREEELRTRIEREKAAEQATSKQKVNKGISLDIYDRLCDLLDNECVYKDPQLDREMLAERLDTNRTYLSQIIKEHTGKNLTSLINQYRVDEALRILSDERKNNCSLEQLSADLGFMSKLTFFRVFKNIVGMSPHQYRITRHKVYA